MRRLIYSPSRGTRFSSEVRLSTAPSNRTSASIHDRGHVRSIDGMTAAKIDKPAAVHFVHHKSTKYYTGTEYAVA
jgi:hypothetical protein